MKGFPLLFRAILDCFDWVQFIPFFIIKTTEAECFFRKKKNASWIVTTYIKARERRPFALMQAKLLTHLERSIVQTSNCNELRRESSKRCSTSLLLHRRKLDTLPLEVEREEINQVQSIIEFLVPPSTYIELLVDLKFGWLRRHLSIKLSGFFLSWADIKSSQLIKEILFLVFGFLILRFESDRL